MTGFFSGNIIAFPEISYNKGVKSSIRLDARLLPLLVILLLLMQVVDPSRVWTVLLVGLGGLWLISFLWARSLKKHLMLLREMRYGWVQVGDALEERFTLKNTGWLPATWVELEDQSSLPGYDASLATGVDGSGANQWRKKGTCNRRGLYQLGPTSIHSGDPFGVYSVTLTDSARAMLMVMPPVVPLPPLDIIPGGYSGEGRPLPDAPERTVDASSVREYLPGDSLRLVHWKTTARHAKPFVRLFDGTPATDWWVLLDLQAEAQAGSGEESTVEHGIILAASLADRGLRAHRGVGLIVNGKNPGLAAASPGHGATLGDPAQAGAGPPGDTPLAEVLERARPSLGRNASLLVITAASRLDWIESLPLLRRRGIRPTVLLLDLHSFDGKRDNAGVAAELERMQVACHMLPREIFDRPEAQPGSARSMGVAHLGTGQSHPGACARRPALAGVGRMMSLAWNWSRRNYNLVLLLSAATCLALALGRLIRGGTWSWLLPVSLLAVLCGWGAGASRINAKQAWLSSIFFGLPGVFAYVAGLFAPLWALLLAVLSLRPQFILWFSERAPVDLSLVLAARGRDSQPSWQYCPLVGLEPDPAGRWDAHRSPWRPGWPGTCSCGWWEPGPAGGCGASARPCRRWPQAALCWRWRSITRAGRPVCWSCTLPSCWH